MLIRMKYLGLMVLISLVTSGLITLIAKPPGSTILNIVAGIANGMFVSGLYFKETEKNG